MSAARFTALVLAGRRGGGDALTRATGVDDKCLIPLAGEPMLVHVLRALAGSAEIGRIAVVLHDPATLAALVDAVPARAEPIRALPAAATPSATVLRALEALGDPWPILVTTGDHPLLTSALVDSFCRAARAGGGAVAVGLVAEPVIRAAYPQTRRTYLRFRDGGWSGANLFALLAPESRAAVAFWQRAERERKRPWRIARAFGIVALIAYLLGALRLEAAMRHASRAIGAEARAVPLDAAEAAIDVDRPDDLALAEAILARRAGPRRLSGGA